MKISSFLVIASSFLPLLACTIEERQLSPDPPPSDGNDDFKCEDPVLLWGKSDPYFASYEKTKGDCAIRVPGGLWTVNAEPTDGNCELEEQSKLSSGCGLKESLFCAFDDGGVAEYSYVLRQTRADGPLEGEMSYRVTSPGGSGDCSDEYDLTLLPADLPYECDPYDDWDGDYYRFAEILTGGCAELESGVTVNLDLDEFPAEDCEIVEESSEEEGCGYTLNQECEDGRFNYSITQDAPGGLITAIFSLSVDDTCESTYRIQYWPL